MPNTVDVEALDAMGIDQVDVAQLETNKLGEDAAECLVLPTTSKPEQVVETTPLRPRIAGLVLAAGSSRRMEPANKLLQPWRGEALVRHAVRAAVQSGATPVYLVVGHQAEAVARVTADLPVVIVYNPDYTEGLSSSLQTGLRALPDEIDGVLVALGDMPRINSGDLRQLQAAFNPTEGRAICVPSYHGKRGNPVLLGRQLFPKLLRLQGDQGARRLIRCHEHLVIEVAVEDPGVLLDVDTPAALERLRLDEERPFS